MAFWDADLTTRMGAETATGQAGMACVQSNRGALGRLMAQIEALN